MTEKRKGTVQKNAILILEHLKAVEDTLKVEYEEFQKKKADYLRELSQSDNKFEIKEKIIHLNVGGGIFTASKRTLLKAEGTMLGAMFSGRYEPGPKDKEDRYFIDRPPGPFKTILNCLRTDTKLTYPDEEDETEMKRLKKEIEYYGMIDFFKTWPKKPKLEKKVNEEEVEENSGGVGVGVNWKSWKFDLIGSDCKLNNTNGKGRSVIKKTSSGYQIAIIKKGAKISKVGGRFHRFAFKIISDPYKWIGVGVVQETKVKNKDISWSVKNHLTYIWTSNGFNWDDHNQGVSNKKIFYTGDLIDCEVDCKKKTLKMTNRANGDVVTMNISSFPVYPCALFFYIGEVEIAKPKVYKSNSDDKEDDDDDDDESDEEKDEGDKNDEDVKVEDIGNDVEDDDLQKNNFA